MTIIRISTQFLKCIIAPVLGVHLNGTSRLKYFSQTKTEKHVNARKDDINETVHSFKESKFFTVIGDSKTGIAHKDQTDVLIFVAFSRLLRCKCDLKFKSSRFSVVSPTWFRAVISECSGV